MNTALARDAIAAMKQHPEHVDMSVVSVGDFQLPDPPCGSVGCCAGFVVAVARQQGYPTPYKNDLMQAGRLLEMSDAEAEELFYMSNWPKEFKETYVEAEIPAERVAIIEQVVEAKIAQCAAEES